MKNCIFVPLKFLFIFIVSFCIVCLYNSLVGIGSFQNFWGAILLNLRSSFFVGYIASIFIILNSIVRLQNYRVAIFGIIFIIALPIFIFGYNALFRFENSGNGEAMLRSGDAETLLYFEGGGLHFLGLQDSEIESLILYRSPAQESFQNTTEQEARLSLIPSAVYDSQSEIVQIPIQGAELLRIPTSEIENTESKLYPRLFAASIESLFAEISASINTGSITLPYIVLLSSLTLYVMSMSFFLRLSRWPYINIVLAVVFLFGGLYCMQLLSSEGMQERLALLLHAQILPYTASIVLAISGFIFALLTIINPRKREWLREMNS